MKSFIFGEFYLKVTFTFNVKTITQVVDNSFINTLLFGH